MSDTEWHTQLCLWEAQEDQRELSLSEPDTHMTSHLIWGNVSNAVTILFIIWV